MSYETSVGFDLEGDAVLYVKRGQTFLDDGQLEQVADYVQEQLNEGKIKIE